MNYYYYIIINNNNDDHINVDSSLDILLLLMDRSQLVMTIFGLIANITTALTLIKNAQVGGAITIIFMSDMWSFTYK